MEFGSPDDLPGGENERFLEYWNLVFMQYDQDPPGKLTPLPAPSIDTGLGLNRMALIEQGAATIFETDQFAPLMTLGRELSDSTRPTDERALRILADHSRAMTFLIGDGIVPSNEDRGYILRRVMRRAIQQGHRIGIEGAFLPGFVEQVIDLMGPAYPELVAHRPAILKWVAGEEEGFRRTLEQGTKLLDDLLDAGEVGADDAFKLHDTFGFPIELTREIAAERGVPFAQDTEFERLMGEQRARSSAAAKGGQGRARGGDRPCAWLRARDVRRLRGPRGSHGRAGARDRGRRARLREARRVPVLRPGRRPGERRGHGRLRGRRLPRRGRRRRALG